MNQGCMRGPDNFRCVYESDHDGDCFGYRVVLAEPEPEQEGLSA